MAWQRSTGIHAGRPSPIAAMLGGMQGDELQRHKQTAAALRAAAVFLIRLLMLLGRGRWSPLSAPSIAGHGGQAPKEARQDADAFSPRHGWRVEKPRHGREAQGEDSRFASTARCESERPAGMFGRAGGRSEGLAIRRSAGGALPLVTFLGQQGK